jgi:hypothetical protein
MPNHMLIITKLLFSHFMQYQAKYFFGYSFIIKFQNFLSKFIILYIYLVIIYHNIINGNK